MSARDTLRRNKTAVMEQLSGDYSLILQKVYENKNKPITEREYNNLKSINKEDAEGHVVELLDKIMNKGEPVCQDFLSLLQTDQEIQSTYPELKKLWLSDACPLTKPVQVASVNNSDALPQGDKKEQYQLKSQPVGLCVIINNENFVGKEPRRGTNQDAQRLAKVFSWLGFRVLMCKDLTQDQMDRALKYFASLSDQAQLQGIMVKEWFGTDFIDLQQPPKHGDAFVCCLLSHGQLHTVQGVDNRPLSIKQITRTFKGTDQSALTGKPKVFLIQACQGGQVHGRVSESVEADDSPSPSIPEEADVLVAYSTVEDYLSFRDTTHGSWFIQSVCQQLEEHCPRREEIVTILQRVNDEVSYKEEFSIKHGKMVKQMPEVRFTLRKKLVFAPAHA